MPEKGIISMIVAFLGLKLRGKETAGKAAEETPQKTRKIGKRKKAEPKREERKAAKEEAERTASMPEALSESAGEVKKTESEGIKLEEHRIVTDFDKILAIITSEGRLDVAKIAKKLGINKQRVEECCNILEEEGLIETEYPPIGDTIVQTKDYKQKKQELEKIMKEKAQKKRKGAGFPPNPEK